jgi:methyl-accepting chemotaxis protein
MTVLDWFQRRKLRWNLVFWYTLALALVSGLMALVITDRIKGSLDHSLERRGMSLVSGMVQNSQLPLLQQRASEAEAVLAAIIEDGDVAYAAIVAEDGRKILAQRFGRDLDAQAGQAVLSERLVDPDFRSLANGRTRVVHDERRLKHFAGRVVTTRLTRAAPETAEADEELLLGGFEFDLEPMRAPDPVVTEEREEILGYVLLGMSKASTQAALEEVVYWIGGTVVLGFALFIALSLLFISRVFILRPISAMQGFARSMSEYDLTGRAEKYADDELGNMADALNRLGENLHGVLGRIQGVTDSLATVADRVASTSDVVSRGAGSTASSVDQTSSSMQQMLVSLKGIAENVEVLAQSAEESSSSILEMAATNDEVASNIHALAASVEETTTAIEQMTFSIKEVAKNVEDLSATAEETSSSMNEMDVSISQVETNANETAKLSEQVSVDARTAGDALQKTIAGIDKIKDSSRVAADVIEALGQKIGTIGNILNVIDDVAEQTNLLALNAAIIAAQAGEHGKGFAVVADEIKDLAERTGASTKEISDLIRSVQDESKNAITAMERGVQNVEDGVRLSGEADAALRKILESAGRSTQMVKAIARATVEQARGSKQVTGAINRIAETVQEIARATAEQARGSEQIMGSAEKMKIITKHVERSSQEQARGSKQITQAIENISEMVQQLNRAQKEQTKGAEQVMIAVENIKEVTDAQNAAVKDLESAVDTLAEQSDVLRGEVKRFRV